MNLLSAAAEVVLALDQGTTSTKCVLVDREGVVRFTCSAPLRMLTTQNQWREQSPTEILDSALAAMHQGLAYCASSALRVAGVAISNQRETALAWDAVTGAPMGNAISWQCRRSSSVCARLGPQAKLIEEHTGLVLDPLVSASKWAWLLTESEDAVRARALAASGVLRLGNVDAWLLWWLTGGGTFATDHTNASRTALLDLATLGWGQPMLDLFGIPADSLPSIQPSASRYGVCTAIEELRGVPVVCLVGDSHAALAAQAGPHAVKATYGTGSSLMLALDALASKSASLARAVGFSTAQGVQYALEGNIAMSGAALKWVGEFLGLADPVADAVTLAASVPDSAGVILVPAMVGLGAPWWDAEARGAVLNLGPQHTKAHMAHAALDAIAHQVADVVDAMEGVVGKPLASLNADGGATRNDALMQLQADLLGRPVVRSSHEELSAIGAARLGGITLGWWDAVEVSSASGAASSTFHPAISEASRIERRNHWKAAVQRTLSVRSA